MIQVYFSQLLKIASAPQDYMSGPSNKRPLIFDYGRLKTYLFTRVFNPFLEER